MKKCAKCKIEYPSEILSPMFGAGIAGDICGICALEISNAIHGINKTNFKGETAEDFRLQAINWRNI